MNPIKRLVSVVKKFFFPYPKIITKISVSDWLESGQWATVKSSYVRAIRYSQYSHKLHVQYKGAICTYSGISPMLAKQMFSSDSLGRFARQHLFSLPYTKS